MSEETFKQTRRGSFATNKQDAEAINKEIHTRLGQGDWEITWARSGNMISFVASQKKRT